MPTRPGQQQAQNASTTYNNEATTANTDAQADLSQASQDQTNLRSGKMVGADPYLNPQYLAAVNQLRSGSLDQQNNAADAQLRANNARTGGMNSTATTGAIGTLAGQKMRLGNQLGAEQTAGDWAKNVGYQLNLAQQPLESAKAQGGLYSTATSGLNAANNNLSQFGLASYAPWMDAITAAGGAGAGALSLGTQLAKNAGQNGGCWIAAAVYDGWDDPRTIDVRRWLNEEFTKTLIGTITMAIYLTVGRQVAWLVRRSSLLRSLFRPLFNKALKKARGIS